MKGKRRKEEEKREEVYQELTKQAAGFFVLYSCHPIFREIIKS